MVSERYSLYLAKIEELAYGRADPKRVSIWAEQEELRLDKMGASLTPEEDELLSNLQIAGALNDNGSNLYGPDDFMDWYQEAKIKL